MVARIENSVLMVGNGRVASSLVKTLGDTVHIVSLTESLMNHAEALDLHRCALAIVAEDEWVETHNSLIDRLRYSETPVLIVAGRMSRVFVGPLERPGTLGCTTCLNIRWRNARRLSPLMSSHEHMFEPGVRMRLPLTIKDEDISVVAQFVADQVLRIMGGQPTEIEGNVGVMRAGSLRVDVQNLVASDDCPRCRVLVTNHPTTVRWTSGFHHISDTHSLRVQDIELSVLRNAFVDRDIGLISEISSQRIGHQAVGVNAHIQLSHTSSVSGFGIALTLDEGQKTAILEALERLCGRYPSTLASHRVGSYTELSATAVHPKVFGLHDDAVYAKANRGYEQFTANRPYHWVEGLSCQSQETVLVPEQLAYHRVKREDESKFVQQSSNGCAIGGAFEEAVLYGLLEVIERDAFLNTWYGQLPVPEVSVNEVIWTEEALHWVEYLRQHGYVVRLFDISHDLGIPCALAVAINRQNRFPNVICGTAAHLRWNVAVNKAVQELSAQVFGLLSTSPDKVALAYEKFEDSLKIQTIADHRLVGALPAARSRWSFLLDRPGFSHTSLDSFPDLSEKYDLASNDMTNILQHVLDDVFAHGFDVIVVPLTRVEIVQADLHAVRVLVPGMLSMTFGHEYRRVQGLDRVLQLPYRLGYINRPLRIEELNKDPHPFG